LTTITFFYIFIGQEEIIIMFKDKAYVCNLCRKVITYSPDEGGKTMPCPFCKSSVTLPSSPAGIRTKKTSRTRFRAVAGLLVLLLAAGTAAVIYLDRSRAPSPQAAALGMIGPDSLLHEWVTQCRVGEAPQTLKARGVDVAVAVTDVRYGCPEIYQTALQRVVPTETPVCCIRVALTNTGKTPIRIRPWRLYNSINDEKLACLKRADGHPYSLVSFGIESDPVGAIHTSELLPDDTRSDLILFLCGERPRDDVELRLPCENIGGKGDLCFRIPNGMIR